MINLPKIHLKLTGECNCIQCRKCSELTDYVVILPDERKFLTKEGFPCLFIKKKGVDFLVGDCAGCNSLDTRMIRPIDCKTYPYAVFFIEDGFYLMVCTVCPLHDNLPTSFTEEVKSAWLDLLEYEEVREHVKKVCAMKNLNTKLSWNKVELLRKDRNKV